MCENFQGLIVRAISIIKILMNIRSILSPNRVGSNLFDGGHSEQLL